MSKEPEKRKELRKALIDHQNNLQKVIAKLFEAYQEKRQLEARIRQIEREINIARGQRIVSGVARRVFGPVGVVVTGLATVEA